MFLRLLGSKRRSLFTVLGFLVAVAVLTSISPTIDDVQTNTGNDAPADAPSVLAGERIDELFPGEDALPAILTISTPDANDTAPVIGEIVDWFRDAGPDRALTVMAPHCGPEGPGADCAPVPEQISEDGRTALIIVPLTGDPSGETFRDDVAHIHDDLTDLVGDRAQLELTGPAGIVTDTIEAFGSGNMILLAATIVLVLAILLAVYRAPLMALVPLVGVAIAMRLAQGIGALLADVDVIEINGQTASIMTVLLFGIGTDYALIISARYREQLATGLAPPAAMATAMNRILPTLLSSVSTIVLAMFALLLCVSPALHSFGPYLVVGVVAMTIISLSFTPALMVLSGRALFWPRSMAAIREQDGSPFWARVADFVLERSRTVLAATLALLIILSLGLTGYKESFNFLTGFRVSTSSAAGQEVLADEFGVGSIAPATILVEGTGITPEAMERIAVDLPTRSSHVESATFSPMRGLAEGPDGTSGRLTVEMAENPYEPEGFESTPVIGEAVRELAEEAGVGEPRISVTGESATTLDIKEALDRDMRLMIPVMLLIVGVVLALLLRSTLAPLYLVATLVLSYTATMGATVWITTGLQGDSGIGNRVAVYVLVFLVALGVDYNIFIMARFRQELVDHDVRTALRIAVERTGGVVSSAGLILAGTFAVLMTQPIRELYQFGLAMAIGILLDTFIVRPLLVPAIVSLLGDRALWPQRTP